MGEREKLLPQDDSRWSVLALDALADSILENAMPVVAERMLRDKSEWWTSRQEQFMDRNARSLALLEKEV
ncbi:Uncharacterised protein [Chlamydia trachomatis]|nr:Uncharacterised protein [Chlamydia trachomatis]